jgi:carbamoyl-phosphate synthase large subunit
VTVCVRSGAWTTYPVPRTYFAGVTVTVPAQSYSLVTDPETAYDVAVVETSEGELAVIVVKLVAGFAMLDGAIATVPATPAVNASRPAASRREKWLLRTAKSPGSEIGLSSPTDDRVSQAPSPYVGKAQALNPGPPFCPNGWMFRTTVPNRLHARTLAPAHPHLSQSCRIDPSQKSANDRDRIRSPHQARGRRRVTNVLISSAGRRGELVEIFRRVLGGNGRVLTADMSRLSSAGLMGDGHHVVPAVSDPGFLNRMLTLCAENGVRHIVPTIDTELPFYAMNRSRFLEAGITVWVSSPEAVAIAQDKRLTNQFLRDAGLPCPAQRDLERRDEVPLPVIAKPARGSSSVGLTRVDTEHGFDSLDRSLDYVVEEIVPGVEFTVDCLVDLDGRCQATVPRRRLETRAGEVSKGWLQANTAVEQVAREVMQALPGAFAVLNVQIFFDVATESLSVIEINARFGGGFPLAYAAGADFPGWMIRHVDGQQAQPALTWRPDVVMLRYDQGVYAEAAELGLRS